MITLGKHRGDGSIEEASKLVLGRRWVREVSEKTYLIPI